MAIMFLIDLGFIIYLIVEVFHYFKVKADAFTRDEVEQSAEAHAKKLKYTDPVINCDYCGAKIDTRKYKTCPVCNAVYDKDKEWTRRHNVPEGFVDEGTEEIISLREQKAAEECRIILQKVKRKIAILVTVNVVMIILSILAVVFFKTPASRRFREGEELNESEREHFSEADYSVKGNNVIIDDGKIKISVVGLYTEELKQYTGRAPHCDVKVGLRVENHSGEDMHISMYCYTMDNITKGTAYFILGNNFRDGTDAVVYEKFNMVDYGKISSFGIDKITYYSVEGRTYYESTEPVVIETTCDKKYHTVDLSGRELIYSNEKVDVYSYLNDRHTLDEYYFIIVNKTDKNYRVKAGQLRIDGKEVKSYGMSDVYLHAGGTLLSNGVYSYEDAYKNRSDSAKIDVSISFKCQADPSFDFSTGYMVLAK